MTLNTFCCVFLKKEWSRVKEMLVGVNAPLGGEDEFSEEKWWEFLKKSVGA